MATTTNFGWETPDDTDLVKDGAAAIRTLGQSIDTSMADLEGGTTGQILAKNSNTDMDFVWIANDQGDITAVTAGTGISGGGTSGAVTVTNSMATAITTAGDLIKGTGSGTFDRLGIGSTAQVLTVVAGAPAWATSASGMTLINAGGTALSGASTTVSSIPTTYKHLYIVVTSARTSVSSPDVNLRLNGDTASNYAFAAVRNIGGTLLGRQSNGTTSITEILTTSSNSTVLEQAHLQAWIPNYNTTGGVAVHYQYYGHNGSNAAYYGGSGTYNNSAAISSMTFLVSGATFTNGTIYVYGVL